MNIKLYYEKFSKIIRIKSLRFKYTVYHLLVIYRISLAVMFIIQPIKPCQTFQTPSGNMKKFGMVLETFYIFLVIYVMQITVTCERETYNTNNFK